MPRVNLNNLGFCDLRSMQVAIMSDPEPCGELNRLDKKKYCQTPYEWYRLTDYPLGRKHIDLSQWGELIFCKPHTAEQSVMNRSPCSSEIMISALNRKCYKMLEN